MCSNLVFCSGYRLRRVDIMPLGVGVTPHLAVTFGPSASAWDEPGLLYVQGDSLAIRALLSLLLASSHQHHYIHVPPALTTLT